MSCLRMNEQTHHLTIADKASVFAPPPPILPLIRMKLQTPSLGDNWEKQFLLLSESISPVLSVLIQSTHAISQPPTLPAIPLLG